MLSQSEIDALLSGQIEPEQADQASLAALESAAETAGKSVKAVRPYNFWSPERFSKDQIRAVELVHEDLAERLSTLLPALLRREVRPRVSHVEQGRFDDLTTDFPDSILYNVIAFDPLPGRGILVIGPELTWMILERLLGGSGLNPNIELRTLTDIGQTLIQGVVKSILPDIKAAWNKVVALDLRLDDSTVNKLWVSMLMRNARMVLISLEVALSNITGNIDIFIPLATLKPIKDELTPTAWMAGQDQTSVQPPETRADLERFVKDTEVTLRVILGETTLTVKELTSLNRGDVLPLNTSVGQPLIMNVDNAISPYRVLPGTSGSRLAVQVLDNV